MKENKFKLLKGRLRTFSGLDVGIYEFRPTSKMTMDGTGSAIASLNTVSRQSLFPPVQEVG